MRPNISDFLHQRKPTWSCQEYSPVTLLVVTLASHDTSSFNRLFVTNHSWPGEEGGLVLRHSLFPQRGIKELDAFTVCEGNAQVSIVGHTGHVQHSRNMPNYDRRGFSNVMPA